MKALTVLMGLALATSGVAQTWDVRDLGTLSLVACYGKQDGVYCDFNFTLTKKQTAAVVWSKSDFKVFKQDGTSEFATNMAFVDGNFDNAFGETRRREIIAGVPLKVQAYFNIPNSVSGFRALAYNEKKFDNIPVRPFGTTPTTPTPLPAGSNVKGFSISLSNCQLQGSNYVCTATLTPTK